MLVNLPAYKFEFLAKELGFIKIYRSSYTPTGNSIIGHTHSFLIAYITKLIFNHQVDWDETVVLQLWCIMYSPTHQLENLHLTLCLDVTPL